LAAAATSGNNDNNNINTSGSASTASRAGSLLSAAAAAAATTRPFKSGFQLHSHATTTTACEGSDSATTSTTAAPSIPDYLLKYDHYNGVIIHLDWIFQHPNNNNASKSASANTFMYKENSNKSSGDEQQTQQIKQAELEALALEWNQHPDEFERILESSLKRWKQEGRKGIWVHLPKSMAPLVPVRIDSFLR
jgi:hypothetical protein